MTPAHIADFTCIAIAFLGPVWIAVRIRSLYVAIVAGALVFWFALVLAGPLISALDSTHGTRPSDTLFGRYGWILGFAYAASLTGANTWRIRIRERAR